MNESSAIQPEDLLDSWKDIAGYLKRDISTVQRWEHREDMPVHRHVHDVRRLGVRVPIGTRCLAGIPQASFGSRKRSAHG